MGFFLLAMGVGMGGGEAVAGPDTPGVEYMVPDGRVHYTVPDDRPHYQSTGTD